MADETTISLETLEGFISALGTADADKLRVYIDNMKAAGKETASFGDIVGVVGEKSAEVFRTLTSGAKTATDGFGNFASAAKTLSDVTDNLWSKMTQGINDFINRQDVASDGILNFGVRAAIAFEPLLGVIPKTIEGVSSVGDAGYASGMKLATAYSSVSPLMKKASDTADEFFQRVTAGADVALGYERNIINMAAAQGRLGDILGENKDSFVDLQQEYMNMTDLAYQSAKATGQTVQSMIELSDKVKTVPGALSEAVEVNQDYMSQLVVMSRLAAGFGISQDEVASKVTTLYDKMGVSGIAAYETIANIYNMASDSKLRMDSFAESVLKTAEKFNMLGDNTAAATKIVKAFDDAFQDSEISPEAMEKVIGGLTTGIERLDLGKQAFISSITGGPGGLAGAYQMEYAIQTGNLEDVLSKTMQAMQQQFGGQILTLKEAAENPAMAGEFYKQVQYLTQVAGVAGSDREAYRILEAMQNGVLDSLSLDREGAGKQDSLVQAMDRGSKQQEKSNTMFTRIHQDMEIARTIQNNTYLEAVKQTNLLTGMSDAMNLGQARSATAGAVGAMEWQNQKGLTEFVNRGQAEMIEGFAKTLGGVLESLESFGKSVSAFGIGGKETNLNESVNIPQMVRAEPRAGLITPAIQRMPKALTVNQIINESGQAVSGDVLEGGTGGGITMATLESNVRFEPLKIQVEFPDFDNKVKEISIKAIQENESSKITRGGMGLGR